MKLASFVLLASSCSAATIMTGGASSNGIWINYETRLDPASPPLVRSGGGSLTEGNVIKRHICNLDNGTYFGYDLEVVPLPDGRYDLRFGPLTISPGKMHEIFKEVKEVAAWTQLPIPNAPVTMQVRAGDTIALDLFVNRSTGQKITDYLSINSTGHLQTNIAGPARDFTPGDAEIAIISPDLTIDGKPAVSSKAGVSGESVWMDVPERGRFVFSLSPHPDLGMQLAGEVRGASMKWQFGGHEYALTGKQAIASGSSAYNLYVFYVGRMVDQFQLGASGSPGYGIRAR